MLELQKRQAAYLRFNTEDFPQLATVRLSPTQGGDELALPKLRLSLKNVASVWYRRPVPPRPALAATSGARSLALRESAAALDDVWDALQAATWVSDRGAIRRATPRMQQLALARRLGLHVLPTLITNDAAAAQLFLATHVRVIAKPIGVGTVEADEEGPDRLVFTTELARDETERLLASLRSAPVLLQQLQPKRADIRVTVVGRRVFAARIGSPTDGHLDWRAVDPELLVHDRHELPAEIEALTVELVASLGLKFGALDLLWTPDDEYVFLEINPNGQWAWLEQELELPIASALVDLLMRVD